ncbi:hypothetical protein G7Y89_g8109 [Cudoniella acicularis]|uniref:DUF7726 domain-containing protein n=1 Tax=Cudoniella acicularis TaxID=354080 RepID=A0A8H4RI31_9HELO|nr:hypothetical protein G7Y89_g8109 [Cudoniella acicularis]
MASKTATTRQPLGDVSNNLSISAPSGGLEKPASKSTKRKATEEPREEIDIDDDRCQMVDISCDRVRTKIRNFINSGEMKVGEFQKAIGTNSKSYGSFMGQSGAYKGSGSSVYVNAFAFFKHRELNGIKAAKKKVKKEDEAKKTDVSGIELEGEEEEEVPVYDTCDEVRKKIRAYLADPSVTQAGFCREISKTYRDGKKVSSASLTGFLGKKGPTAGNTSAAFYASYVFFEKLRIRDRKPKSKMREEMEGIYAGTGMEVNERLDRGVIVPIGVHPYEDKYGRIQF